MFSSDQINTLIEEAMTRLGMRDYDDNKDDKNKGGNNREKKNIDLTPSEILVIVGILAGALQVDSVLVDRDQSVEITLVGSLKRKTQLEKIMDQVGTMPFDEVMKNILGRY